MTVCLASVRTPPAGEYFCPDEIAVFRPAPRLRFGYPNGRGGVSPGTAIGSPACTAGLEPQKKVKVSLISSGQKYSPGVRGWKTPGAWAGCHITGLTP